MTGIEAWRIISQTRKELRDLRREAGHKETYTQEEVEAEVMCFIALCKMDEQKKMEDDGK